MCLVSLIAIKLKGLAAPGEALKIIRTHGYANMVDVSLISVGIAFETMSMHVKDISIMY